MELAKIIEAVLLAAHEPVSVSRLVSLLDNPAHSGKEIEGALKLLQEGARERSFELKQVASGYRYQVRREYAGWVARFFEIKPQKYSRALLETLALIAYRQPVSRGDIERVRGVSLSGQIMRTLLDREWIQGVGYRETPGRPVLYGTTQSFLDYFNLTNLDELPELPEVRSLEVLTVTTDAAINPLPVPAETSE